MRQVMLILGLSIAIAVLCAPAYAQTNTTSPVPNTQPPLSDTVREFDRLMSNSEQLHRSTLPSSKAPKSIMPVLLAIPQFRSATSDLREAVGAQKSLRAPLQSIEKLIKPFAEYFKDLKLMPSPFDVQEFKGYSQKDLMWETLTTAERVDNNLQIANRLLRASNQSGTVTIQTMQFYAEIESDLKRLKWLADKVAAQR